jgi:hypothetical protein
LRKEWCFSQASIHWAAPLLAGYADFAAEFAAHLAAYKPAGLPPRSIQGAVFCDFLPGFDASLPGYAKRFAAELGSLSYALVDTQPSDSIETMRFLSIGKNGSISIGNLRLFWIYFYRLMGNA